MPERADTLEVIGLIVFAPPLYSTQMSFWLRLAALRQFACPLSRPGIKLNLWRTPILFICICTPSIHCSMGLALWIA
jgi:hypothetical protein